MDEDDMPIEPSLMEDHHLADHEQEHADFELHARLRDEEQQNRNGTVAESSAIEHDATTAVAAAAVAAAAAAAVGTSTAATGQSAEDYGEGDLTAEPQQGDKKQEDSNGNPIQRLVVTPAEFEDWFANVSTIVRWRLDKKRDYQTGRGLESALARQRSKKRPLDSPSAPSSSSVAIAAKKKPKKTRSPPAQNRAAASAVAEEHDSINIHVDAGDISNLVHQHVAGSHHFDGPDFQVDVDPHLHHSSSSIGVGVVGGGGGDDKDDPLDDQTTLEAIKRHLESHHQHHHHHPDDDDVDDNDPTMLDQSMIEPSLQLEGLEHDHHQQAVDDVNAQVASELRDDAEMQQVAASAVEAAAESAPSAVAEGGEEDNNLEPVNGAEDDSAPLPGAEEHEEAEAGPSSTSAKDDLLTTAPTMVASSSSKGDGEEGERKEGEEEEAKPFKERLRRAPRHRYQYIEYWECECAGKPRRVVNPDERKRKGSRIKKVNCQAKFVKRKLLDQDAFELDYYYQHTGHDPFMGAQPQVASTSGTTTSTVDPSSTS